MKKIAVFGGTFNPFHNAHYEVLKVVAQSCLADEILLVPTKLPPHKECDFLADETHRLNMCRLVAKKFDNVTVSDVELKMDGKSYTFNTISELKKTCNAQFFFVCGGDMITTFDKWYRYEELLKMMGIIAIRRRGVDNEEFDKSVKFLRQKGGNVTCLEITPEEISSSQIRKTTREDFGKFVPDFIADYIRQNNLYFGETNA